MRPGAVSLSPPHARGQSMRTTGPLPAFSTAAAIGSFVRGSTRRTVASSLLAPPHAPAQVSRMMPPPPIRLIASTFTFDAGTNASSSRVCATGSAGGCECSCWLAGGRQQARAGYSVYPQGALHQSWRTAAGPRAAARQRTDGRAPRQRGRVHPWCAQQLTALGSPAIGAVRRPCRDGWMACGAQPHARPLCAGPSIGHSAPKLAAQRALSLAVFGADRLGLLQLRAPNGKQRPVAAWREAAPAQCGNRAAKVYLLPQIVHVAPLLRLDLHTVSVVR